MDRAARTMSFVNIVKGTKAKERERETPSSLGYSALGCRLWAAPATPDDESVDTASADAEERRLVASRRELGSITDAPFFRSLLCAGCLLFSCCLAWLIANEHLARIVS